MQISEYLANRLAELAPERSRLLVGLCGRAGAGKTTLAEQILADLDKRGIEVVGYSGDYRFILDSASRKRWLDEKWRVGLDAYVQAINQFNWWNFPAIYADLARLMDGKNVKLENAYNRETGQMDLTLELPALAEGIVCYENCVLGGVEFLETCDVVVLLNTPDEVAFERMMRKDVQRRSLPEIAARYLMTTYSENIFLTLLRERFSSKLVTCDSYGRLGGTFEIAEVQQLPVPLRQSAAQERKRGTIFCDLDGTLIKHVPVPSETGEEVELIDGAAQRLREMRELGYHIVLTTSRPQSKVFGVLDRLSAEGLEFDQVICDLPVGPRHLINDSKDNEVRAFAHVITRDEGIGGIDIS